MRSKRRAARPPLPVSVLAGTLIAVMLVRWSADTGEILVGLQKGVRRGAGVSRSGPYLSPAFPACASPRNQPPSTGDNPFGEIPAVRNSARKPSFRRFRLPDVPGADRGGPHAARFSIWQFEPVVNRFRVLAIPKALKRHAVL